MVDCPLRNCQIIFLSDCAISIPASDDEHSGFLLLLVSLDFLMLSDRLFFFFLQKQTVLIDC